MRAFALLALVGGCASSDPSVQAMLTEDAATEQSVDATAIDVDLKSCPKGMARIVDLCVDKTEVGLNEYNAWRTAVPDPVPGCDESLDGAHNYPATLVCAADGWCKQHDKRLCTQAEWGTACSVGVDPNVYEDKPHWEWVQECLDTPKACPFADWSGTWASKCGFQEASAIEVRSAFRCCADAT